MVSGCMKCVKYLLFIFNFLFLLAGLLLIIIGAIAQAQQSKINNVSAAAILVIVIGCVIFGLAFFGCCGAVKESQCLLMTFGILMIIVLVLCIAAVITALVFRSKVEDLWKLPLEDSLEHYDPNDVKTQLVVWSELQLKEQCCGVNNASDWLKNKFYNSKPGDSNVPGACCNNANATSVCPWKQAQFTGGCVDKIMTKFQQSYVIVGAICGAIAILELLGIIFAFALANAIHKGYNVV